MKWYAYFALKQLFPTGRRLSFFSVLSIVGVALGVMVMFVVGSVMDGFQRQIMEAIVATQGDVRVDSGNIISDHGNLAEFLRSRKEVMATAPYAYGIVMLKCGDRPVFPLLKGISLDDEMRVVPLGKFIKHGSLENFKLGGIILSAELAARTGAAVGSFVELYSPAMIENSDYGEVMLPRAMEVVAIYETGYGNADRNIAIVQLDTMQDLYNLGGGVHGIAIKLKGGYAPERLTFELNRCLKSPLRAASWQEMNRDFLFALRIERTMMFFVLIFILLIAAFSMTGSLVIAVLRKVREIGLINALGGTAWQCAACFMLQGLVIGSIGSTLGIAMGLLTIKLRNHIVAAFVKLCAIDDFMLKFYSFANMPAHYTATNVLCIVAATIALCCIAGVPPAIRAAKINPAEALRNE
jgi:lipoprotein-releasing system permease protein